MSVETEVRVAPEALVVEVGTPPLPRPPEERPPRVEEVTAADVLEHAADLLEEFGWCQHVLGSKDAGRMCAVGAALEAARDLGFPVHQSADGNRTWSPVHPFTDDHNDERMALVNFNNAPGRTKAEVVAKLRQAARRARGQA